MMTKREITKLNLSSKSFNSLEYNPVCVSDDRKIQKTSPQFLSDPPTHFIGAAGVLKYSRESDSSILNITTPLPEVQQPRSNPVKCVHCGGIPCPSLELTWIQDQKIAPRFCCAQRQHLYQMLLKKRFSCEAGNEWSICNLMSENDKPGMKRREQFSQSKELEDCMKSSNGLKQGLGTQSGLRTGSNYTNQRLAETTKILHFRLSRPPWNDCWTVHLVNTAEKPSIVKEEKVFIPHCDHNPAQFGLCQYQGRGFLQKFYSSGKKFLNAFPDGSAQVFYPSGLLAVIIVVTKQKGRVCIVFDDLGAPRQPVRAVFQSDGRGTCYHNNGTIWLALNASGGQCLNEAGAKTCQWNWSKASLHPIFLMLNQKVGVRVLGNQKVFVSFLSRGKQAKFSVGCCCAQGQYQAPNSRSSIVKEEMLVLVSQMKTNLALQHLRMRLIAPSTHRSPKIKLAPHLHAAAQRLVEAGGDEALTDSDKAFIYGCLKDHLCTKG